MKMPPVPEGYKRWRVRIEGGDLEAFVYVALFDGYDGKVIEWNRNVSGVDPGGIAWAAVQIALGIVDRIKDAKATADLLGVPVYVS